MRIRIRTRARTSLLALMALAVAATLGPVPAVAGPAARIDVVVFNVLAPVWAGAEWYPADMDPAFLETEWRR